LGIDYGSKRIGVALSDEGARVAFPFSVVANDKNALFTLKSLCDEEKVGRIVMGESLNSRGEDNQIMAAARIFARTLAEETSLPVSFEHEFLTSVEAHRSSFDEQGKKGRQEVDSSAAALILQRYLDRINK
jgi:putative Holliday junction resolvase